MNVRVGILKQRGKNEIFLMENERELMRKELLSILEESDEIGDPVLTLQCVSYDMGKVIIIWIDQNWMQFFKTILSSLGLEHLQNTIPTLSQISVHVPGKRFSFISHSHLLCATQQSAKCSARWENEILSILSLVNAVCILRGKWWRGKHIVLGIWNPGFSC